MLNEIQEAYEYIYDPCSKKACKRIKLPIFLHNMDLNGLERAMTMIARYFIFDDDTDAVTGRRRAEAALRMWLGYTDGLKEIERLAEQYEYLQENYPWLDHWIEKYMKRSMEKDYPSYDRKAETAISIIASKENQFSSKSIQASAKSNDYKLIRFDKILSNAQVARGPLKKYYLVCAVKDWKAGTNKIIDLNPDGRIKAKDHDKILKLVAAYLIERDRKLKRNSDYVLEPVTFSDISQWAAGGTRLTRNHYDVFTYEDEQTLKRRPLFSFYSAKSGNLSKVIPDEEWMRRCGWGLIDATEGDDGLDAFLKANPNGIFFSDPGASEELRRDKRYQLL